MSKSRDSVSKRGSLLVNSLSAQKPSSYSDDDLYEDDSDQETTEEALPDPSSVPSKLPRVVPSVSLSSTPATTTIITRPQLSYQSDSASDIQSVLTSTSGASSKRAIADNQRSHSTPHGGFPLTWRAGRLESILLSEKPLELPQSTSPPTSPLPRPRPSQRTSPPTPRSSSCGDHKVPHLSFAIGHRNFHRHLDPHLPPPPPPPPLIRRRGVGRGRGRPRGSGRGRGGKLFQRTTSAVDDDGDDENKDDGGYVQLSIRRTSVGGYGWKYGQRHQEALMNTPLLLPRREHHPATDTSLPALDLRATRDPLALLKKACKSDKDDKGAKYSPLKLLSSVPASHMTGRMKSSDGFCSIDLQEFKSCPRLNGYSLFMLVNKRKYGALTSNEDASADPKKESQRKWQAIWSSLPDWERRSWRTKAKRLLKQSELQSKRAESNKNKRVASRRRLEIQLARSEFVYTDLTDIAAHFQILSDAFAGYAKLSDDYDGPVDVASVESSLLDGLLVSMIALLALFADSNLIPGAPRIDDIRLALQNLTYIMPV